jgi:hypothetical protein
MDLAHSLAKLTKFVNERMHERSIVSQLNSTVRVSFDPRDNLSDLQDKLTVKNLLKINSVLKVTIYFEVSDPHPYSPLDKKIRERMFFNIMTLVDRFYLSNPYPPYPLLLRLDGIGGHSIERRIHSITSETVAA